NNDILHEIFTWLRPHVLHDDPTPEEEERRKDARQDLLSMALVCKTFSEHALDALWRELDDLLPVMQLFTESHDLEGDGITVGGLAGGLAGGQDVSHFNHLISEHEWTRFRHYARRVRIIRSSGFGTFEASMLLHLGRRNIGKALFPFTPTLEDVKLEFCGETWSGTENIESPAIARKVRDYAVQLCLSTVCSNVPELRLLTITGLGRISSLAPLLPCAHLEELHVQDAVLGPRSLRTLASIDSLHELDMSFELTDYEFSSCSGLTNLRSLSLSGPMYQIPTILDMVSSTHVRTVRIADPSNKATYKECTECVQVASKFPLLDEFFLVADNGFSFSESLDGPHFVNTSVPLTELIRPLLRHRSLRTLSISRWQPGGFGFSDADVETLATAWPGIVTLMLAVNRAEAVPSLNALVVLARSCPALRTLELPSITIASAEQLRPPDPPPPLSRRVSSRGRVTPTPLYENDQTL
ncbi:hypothetical protein EVJ58_g8677, partial [Rhodofomes roseus]